MAFQFRFMIRMLGIAVPLVLISTVDVAGQRLTEARFEGLLKLLQPEADEPWRTIPWKIALLDAQREAVRSDKPIFIWAMDGHPLGCT